MTKIPLAPNLSSHHLLFQTHRTLHHQFVRHPQPTAVRFRTMAALDPRRRIDDPNGGAIAKTLDGEYPKPMSPPYPAVSKEVELRRAMSAEARSGAYGLSAAEIVFEDEWMVVANKPSGIYCESLLRSLSSTLSGIGTTQPQFHLANRLDRDTSGLMVITKSHKVAGKLVKAFTDHKIKKTYIALCIGCAPKWDRIRISSGHGRSKFGAWRVYSASDVGRALPGGSLVKHMATSFEVLSINEQVNLREPFEFELDKVESLVVEEKGAGWAQTGSEKSSEILIRAYPQSGRTHQIRLHCQYLGLSIKGDVKYGGVNEWKGVTCDVHALHAESLSFDHPITGVPVQFCAPLPSWAAKGCRAIVRST